MKTKEVSKRATILFKKGKEVVSKNVSMARAYIIASEYKRKTGKTVTIRIS